MHVVAATCDFLFLAGLAIVLAISGVTLVRNLVGRLRGKLHKINRNSVRKSLAISPCCSK